MVAQKVAINSEICGTFFKCNNSEMLSRLRTEIFPEAVEAEAFGPDVTKFVSFEPNSNRGSDQFASDVMFGHVTIEKKSGERLTENVVIKIQPSIEVAHRVFDCDAQFSNEILFYTKMIPAFRKYDSDDILSTNFSKFIYGKATCGKNPKDDIIILEDMNAKGYKLTKERLAIDEKHINLALDRIGKYHALSFKLQSEEPEKFQELISQIKATKRDNDGSLVPKNFLTMVTMRGVKPLRDDPRYKDKLEDLCKHFENAAEYADKYQGPSESLNVITHGDFCRNNMMFKYKNNGEPEGVVFFDLATIKYCSPVVDLSFFLALNTSPETRRLHWNEFLQRYYGALSQQLDGHSARPSFETVELEMRRKGVYGYYLCSFFLPSMIKAKTMEDWDKEVLAEEFSEDKLLQEGGPQATDSLADLVRHMLDRNYIFEV